MVKVLFKETMEIKTITVANYYKLGDKVTMDLEWKKPVKRKAKTKVTKEESK